MTTGILKHQELPGMMDIWRNVYTMSGENAKVYDTIFHNQITAIIVPVLACPSLFTSVTFYIHLYLLHGSCSSESINLKSSVDSPSSVISSSEYPSLSGPEHNVSISSKNKCRGGAGSNISTRSIPKYL